MDSQPPSIPSPDLLGDLLGPLAIEGPPGTAPQSDPRVASGLEGDPNVDALALAPVEDQTSAVQVSFLRLVYRCCVDTRFILLPTSLATLYFCHPYFPFHARSQLVILGRSSVHCA